MKCPHCNGTGDFSGSFTKRLITLRLARGLTLRELGAKIGTGQAHLSELERGNKLPSLTLFRQLAAFYGVSLDELMGDAS